MNGANIKGYKKINGGKETLIHCPLSQRELNLQLGEIFGGEHYKEALRKKNAVYLDVGACIGLASIYFYDHAKKIYALEPSREAYQALEFNLKDYPKVETFNVGLAHYNGKSNFYATAQDSTTQIVSPKSGDTIYKQEEIDVVTIDKFMEQNKIKHIDVMKIDVEGYEYPILSHPSFAKVANKIDFIIGESHFTEIAHPYVIPKILEEFGFTTTFPKGKHNTFSTMTTKFPDSPEKSYQVLLDTIFIAERKKK